MRASAAAAVLSGANWSNGANLGVFYRNGSYVASNSDRNYGARISSQSKPGQTAIARTVPRPLAKIARDGASE